MTVEAEEAGHAGGGIGAVINDQNMQAGHGNVSV
jgi:hypothetical protein